MIYYCYNLTDRCGIITKDKDRVERWKLYCMRNGYDIHIFTKE